MMPWYVHFSPLCPDNVLTMVLCSSNIAPGIRTVTRSMCEQIQGWRKRRFFAVEVCRVKGESRTVQSTLHDPHFFFQEGHWGSGPATEPTPSTSRSSPATKTAQAGPKRKISPAHTVDEPIKKKSRRESTVVF